MRGDIDHEALKPAAWRVDGYLEGVEEEDLSLDALRGHRLAFPTAPDPRDRMARRDDGDDLVVRSWSPEPKSTRLLHAWGLARQEGAPLLQQCSYGVWRALSGLGSVYLCTVKLCLPFQSTP